MRPQTSTSIALEGIGFTDSTLVSVLGFGFIQIIIPIIPIRPELLSGGFSDTFKSINFPTKRKDQKQTTTPVTVKLTLNGKTTSRTYMVRPKRFRMVVAVVNIINTLTSTFTVGIDNIKKTSANIVNVLFNNK